MEPYLLEEEIGRGGMGIVYRAVHADTGQVVAIKTVLPEDARSLEPLARFRREAEAVQRLDHPHCLPIYEVGCSSEGVPFFSMKLALGGSLFDLKGKYRGRWLRIAALLTKISGAVHHAHSQGVLHRDLKPGNILFTEDYEPLVMDFGLAKQLTGTSDLTQSCAVLGTPNYVAPEQAAGKTRELTPAADIYSLGAILYELLTGRPPFVGDNPLEVLQKVATLRPERPRRFVASIPVPLEIICMRCLEKRPQDRYPTAKDLADDLECWLTGQPIVKRPCLVRLSSMLRWCAWPFAFVIGAILLVFALALTWQFRNQRKLPGKSIPIAVLLENLDRNASPTQIFGETTQEMKRALATNEELEVSDPSANGRELFSSAVNPLQYGRSVNASVVLTGGIRRVDRSFRLVTRMIRTDTGEVVWHKHSLIPADQITNQLPVICKQIATELHRKWLAEPHNFLLAPAISVNPEAKIFFTKARELAACRTKSDMRGAAALFQRAVEKDSHYVLARALLAYSQWTLAYEWGERENIPLAISNAKIAIAQDPESAEARRVLANCFFDEARYTQALEEYENVLEINPESSGCNLSIGECLREMGHPDQALPWFETAVKLEPAHGVYSKALGETLLLVSRDEQAYAALQNAMILEPDQPDSFICLSVLRAWQQRFDEADALCSKACQRFPEYRYGLEIAAMIKLFRGSLVSAGVDYERLRKDSKYQHGWECYSAINPSSALAYIAAQRGDIAIAQTLHEEAVKIDEQLLEKYPHNSRILHDLAATYATAGDTSTAMGYLKQAMTAGWVEHRSTMVDPRFHLLSSSRDFQDLLANTFPGDVPITQRSFAQRSD